MQQVVADGDARCADAGLVDRVVDEGRVHHDVAVIGQEQVGAALLQVLQSGEGHAVGGALDGPVDIGFDLVL